MSDSHFEIEPVLSLGAYLKAQEAIQQRRPLALRRHVPTYKELGSLADVAHTTIYRLTTVSYRAQLPLDLAYRVITALRSLEFEIGVRDIVEWELPEGLKSPPIGWQESVEATLPGQLIVTLGACLEACKREGELPVPHVTELARAAQMSRRQLERILADEVQRLDIGKLGLVLTGLARAGWALTPEDVLLYLPTETS